MEDPKVDPKLADLSDWIAKDPDYVCMPRHGCSLKRVAERFPDGVPDDVAARALNLSEHDYRQLIAGAIEKLRSRF